MRLVEQTVEGYPFGECVKAAWSSLLGIPMDRVPDFDPGHLGEKNQLEEERRWVRTLGYDVVVVSARGDAPVVPPDVCHLMSGLSPRGPYGHRCVGRGGKLVWDPHPSHAGLLELWSYAFLVPLVDPALEVDGPELIGFCGWLR